MWDRVRMFLEVDGAQRVILVRDTVEADWDRLIEAVTEWGYRASWGGCCAARYPHARGHPRPSVHSLRSRGSSLPPA